jgi:hypothetical protein
MEDMCIFAILHYTNWNGRIIYLIYVYFLISQIYVHEMSFL